MLLDQHRESMCQATSSCLPGWASAVSFRNSHLLGVLLSVNSFCRMTAVAASAGCSPSLRAATPSQLLAGAPAVARS